MTCQSDKYFDYCAAIFKKIRNKKCEFFIISRIIHLLNDFSIEFTTQQLIRSGDKRFLLDLYFPQLKLAIEVDEPYHNHQIPADEKRDRAIVEKAQIDIQRIKISGKPFSDVISEIDGLIGHIRQRKKDLITSKEFVPFGEKYDTKYRLERGELSVSDDARFRRHVDVARIFGRFLNGHQRATIKLGDSEYIWFPKLYKNKDWDNQLSSDGKTIEMKKVVGGRFGTKAQGDAKGALSGNIYVFAHYSDEFGATYYAFKGVFKCTSQRENAATFSRVYDLIEFDGKGQFKPLKSNKQ